MNAPPVSVIVVSRGRPEMLRRCLIGVGQLFYPNFEVVVVADPPGMHAVRDMGMAGRAKLLAFDRPNISEARNLGLQASAGEIVAFIDDDAVPEPTWLDHLTGPFADPAIGAAGGFVRGRNGISWQYRAAFISPTGQDVPIDVDETGMLVPDPPPGHAVKTMGTNCAFRREYVTLIGGFDPVFSFFHDDTDVNLRLVKKGLKTAIVPLAQVHHGFAASDRRRDNRVPISLVEIGASTAAFLRKHAPTAALEPVFAALVAEQRDRLSGFVAAGLLDEREVAVLMKGLHDGIERGRVAKLRRRAPMGPPQRPFLPWPAEARPRGSVRIAARAGGRSQERAARELVAAGNVVTLIRLSPTALYHHVRFTAEGYWLQTGGIFGRACRDEPVFRPTTFRARVEREWRRVAKLRQSRKYTPGTGDENGNIP